MAWLKGCDFSFDKPNLPQLWAAGYRVILIYLSDSGKGFSDAYAQQALDIGFKILPLYETSAGAALGGFATGAAHAKFATAKAAAQGIPASVPIIYALDQQFTDAQLAGPVSEYVRGLASVSGVDELYGGYHQVDYLVKHGFPGRQNFQTYAWSAGKWLPTDVAPIEQFHNGVTVAGGTVDDCRVLDSLIFWEKEMPVTVPAGYSNAGKQITVEQALSSLMTYMLQARNNTQKDAVAKAVWDADLIPVAPTDPTNPNWTAANTLADIQHRVNEQLKSLPAAVVAALPPASTGGISKQDVTDAVLIALAELKLSVGP